MTTRDSPAAKLMRALERLGDRVFGAGANPLRQLGALAFLMFWIALASGAYLFIVFDTSASGALASIDALSRDQRWTGGLVRSLHRYSADAFALLTALHVAREWALGRYAGFRWFSWVSGVPLLWLGLISGLVGYWLVADGRALFVATGIADWAGWLPGFGAALMRNFIAGEAISDRLFSLLVFLHIGAALLGLAGMWVHLQRLARPRIHPRRSLAGAAAAILVALSLAWPALSTAPPAFERVPAAVPIDWFYFGLLPLMYASSPAIVWAIAALGTVLLIVLPWSSRVPQPAPAVVDSARCNGCGRCFEDCPYGAVILAPRSDGRRFALQAAVASDQCAGCGICVGACPSSTPFRSVERLVTGIDLLDRPLSGLRERLISGLGMQPGATVLFGCDEGASVEHVAAPGVVTVSLPCSAMLPPAFADFALRRGAARVVVASCGTNSCTYLLGGRWIAGRLAGTREPALRRHARGPRVQLVEALRGDEQRLREALQVALPLKPGPRASAEVGGA